jgi:SAM-dependent methyltransferase
MAYNFRESIKQRISPRSYQYLRYLKWLAAFYIPKRLASVFVRRAPRVEGFPTSPGSQVFLRQLRDVNVARPTRMCRIMTWHGSDKGRGWHNYTTIYSSLFDQRFSEPLQILEIGLGTNNPNLISTMGVAGRPGASLRGWRELFPHARIYGADIDRDILFQEDRINTFFCDQLDCAAIDELWSQPGLLGGADIIIDDGLHRFEGNASFLDHSLEHLRPGGVYVIEDISNGEIEQWRIHLETVYSRRFPDYQFALVLIPNPLQDCDNNLVFVRKLP